MTLRNMAVLACRILGILAILQALSTLQVTAATTGSVLWGGAAVEDAAAIVIATVVPFVIHLCAGICLWLFAERIAPHLIKERDSDIVAARPDAEDLLIAAFSVIGLWFFVQAVIRLLQYLLNLWVTRLSAPYGLISRELQVQFVVLAVQLAIGLYLFLGARGLVGILRNLREAGTKKTE